MTRGLGVSFGQQQQRKLVCQSILTRHVTCTSIGSVPSSHVCYLYCDTVVVLCHQCSYFNCAEEFIIVIERVRQKFALKTGWFANCSYMECLQCLHMDSLELSHLCANVIWCYKVIFGHVHVDVNDFFAADTDSHFRGHPCRLFKKRSTDINIAQMSVLLSSVCV